MKTAACSLLALLLSTPGGLLAQDESRPVGPEAFAAIRSFFAYDTALALDLRSTEDSPTGAYRREKIVFTGSNGSRVPGYLAVPKGAPARYPVVIAIHSGAGSKDAWWQENSYEQGRAISDRLLAANIAVLSLDARFHGERSQENDYESFASMWFGGKKFTWIRDGLVQTARDYRRALDYLATRPDIDIDRVGVIGYSLGGILSVHLTAFDDRPRATVVCVAAVDEPWLVPLAPINVASGLGRTPMLLLAGRTDKLATVAKTEALFKAIPGARKKVLYFESGHQLPAAYADSAATWLRAQLN